MSNKTKRLIADARECISFDTGSLLTDLADALEAVHRSVDVDELAEVIGRARWVTLRSPDVDLGVEPAHSLFIARVVVEWLEGR